ncbi:hypothetical protein FRB95_010371 [Tulasnella sp. JGI-2019a]|nr:hypothetical protein FRB95_010371 [Tulasnella sp. JGI-2019a]
MSSQSPEADVKPDIKPKVDERIEVAVTHQGDGTEIKFRMKMHQKFEKVFTSYEVSYVLHVQPGRLAALNSVHYRNA